MRRVIMEPILIPCEGSLGSGHGLFARGDGVVRTMCAMCGEYIEVTSNGLTVQHDRRDILAMLNRGDFNA